MLVSTSSLFGGLTRKQVQALVFALENGYYQVPKRVTTEEMASKLKLPRTTYEEHLRKAEGKVLRSMAPYISLGPAKSPIATGDEKERPIQRCSWYSHFRNNEPSRGIAKYVSVATRMTVKIRLLANRGQSPR